MIDYIIRELDLDEEQAKYVRRNPEKYHIDYETFKVF